MTDVSELKVPKLSGLLLLLLILSVGGCGPLQRGIVREKPTANYVITETALTDTTSSDKILGKLHFGDKVTLLGWYRTGRAVSTYYVAIGPLSGFVNKQDLVDSMTWAEIEREAEQIRKVEAFSTEFTVAKDDLP